MNIERRVVTSGGQEVIEYRYDIADAGYLRFEIMDDVLFVHPVLEDVTMHNFKHLKQELYNVTRYVMDKFHYDLVFIHTAHKQLARMYGKSIIHEVEDTDTGTLYYVLREDI